MSLVHVLFERIAVDKGGRLEWRRGQQSSKPGRGQAQWYLQSPRHQFTWGLATGQLRGFSGFSYSCLHVYFPPILVPPSFVLPESRSCTCCWDLYVFTGSGIQMPWSWWKFCFIDRFSSCDAAAISGFPAGCQPGLLQGVLLYQHCSVLPVFPTLGDFAQGWKDKASEVG